MDLKKNYYQQICQWKVKTLMSILPTKFIDRNIYQ